MPNKIQDISYPIIKLNNWLKEAKNQYQLLKLSNYNAATLSTVSANGQPSSRVILIKEINDKGLVFYTNLSSRKAQEIKGNNLVSLLFYWEVLKKQVRVEGSAVQVSDADADTYFSSRHYLSKIGAWASKQSQEMNNRIELESRVIKFATKFKLSVPRPDFWSGFKIVPNYFEFWQELSFRLHKRVSYTKNEKGYKETLLFP